jgi:hypothetical protein
MESQSLAKTNELLAQQLQAAEAENQPIQAWFRVKPEDKQAVPSPERTDTVAHQIVDRARSRSGREVNSLNVQRQLGTFTVLAHPALVKEIISQPEIDMAGATHVPALELIRPVKSTPVKLHLQQRKKRKSK